MDTTVEYSKVHVSTQLQLSLETQNGSVEVKYGISHKK